MTAATAGSSDASQSDIMLRQELERVGRCPDCGTQTHRLHYKNANMGSPSKVVEHREPLTVDKAVFNGRCLLCHPISDARGDGSNSFLAYATSSFPQQQQQLQTITKEPDLQQESPTEDNTEIDDSDDNEILDILCRMRRHPHDLQVQTSCFHSLWVLSWETDSARAIGHVGGIPILLKSLRYHLHAHISINDRYNRNNHTSSPSCLQQMQLQSNGLATLQNLSVNKNNKELLVSDEHGGIHLILLSMSTFLQNSEIQRSGCNALANILSNGGCYKCNILNTGGLEVVLKSVEMHKNNEGVCRAAYKCLSLLGQNTSSRREFQKMEKGDMDVDTSARSAQSPTFLE
ncbi:hypothetical protein ACHAXR_010288 [Thalassiosira sp. AJA248-18]